MAEAIAALTAYRAKLKAQGRLLEARAVERCLAIVRSLVTRIPFPPE